MKGHYVQPQVLSVALSLFAGSVLLTGCGWLGHNHDSSRSISVFDVKPGECFHSPKDVKAQLSSLARTSCDAPHTQESYAIVGFVNANGSSASAYPGDDSVTQFAQGSCAQQFRSYVGVDYLDSSLFFTWLAPSARSWEQNDDRNIICFVTTTGATLTTTVKKTKE
jgi:hypothetical protein